MYMMCKENVKGLGRDKDSTNPEEVLLKLRSFSARWEEDLQPTVENINLTLKRGELIGIFGPVGSGKVQHYKFKKSFSLMFPIL